MRSPLPRLHAVTDERIARRPDLDAVAQELAAGGGGSLAFHARGPSLTGLEHYDLAVRLSIFPSVALFINDRLDIALAVNTAGIQLRHDSLPASAARQLNAQWWIGKSVHDVAGAEAAKAEGADYLLVGPVFPTATHPDRPPLGTARLREIAQLGLPVVAIGGVMGERIPELKAVGVYGVAAIRALWDAIEPRAAAQRMAQELEA